MEYDLKFIPAASVREFCTHIGKPAEYERILKHAWEEVVNTQSALVTYGKFKGYTVYQAFLTEPSYMYFMAESEFAQRGDVVLMLEASEYLAEVKKMREEALRRAKQSRKVRK